MNSGFIIVVVVAVIVESVSVLLMNAWRNHSFEDVHSYKPVINRASIFIHVF